MLSPIGPTVDATRLAALHVQAAAEGRIAVVGAIIVNADGKAFVMRRSPHRKLFPRCWDIAGGHVEAGETLDQALAREIHEETGWRLCRIVHLNDVFDWETQDNGRSVLRREFNFLVEVDGDLTAPRLESDKFSEFRWIGLDQLHLLREYREENDAIISRLVKQGLERVNGK